MAIYRNMTAREVELATRKSSSSYPKQTSAFAIGGSASGYGKESRQTRSVSGSGSSVPSSLSGLLSASSQGSQLEDYFKRLERIQSSNNSWSAQQAQKQMDFQKQSAKEAMQFNHDEAELSRLWQERMSNTAHQREIKDLQAAGLNPVLSAMGGSGAPVTSGASASGYTSQGAKGDTDTSLAPALVSLLGSLMQSQASMVNTLTSAQAQERIAALGARTDMFKALTSAASAKEVANISGQTSRDVADLQARTNIFVTGMNNQTSLVLGQLSANAQVASSRIHAAGQAAAAQISGQYGLSAARTNQLGSIITHAMDNFSKEGIASANRGLERELQANNFDFQLEIQKNQFTHDWGIHLVGEGSDILQQWMSGRAQNRSSLISALGGVLGQYIRGY